MKTYHIFDPYLVVCVDRRERDRLDARGFIHQRPETMGASWRAFVESLAPGNYKIRQHPDSEYQWIAEDFGATLSRLPLAPFREADAKRWLPVLERNRR